MKDRILISGIGQCGGNFAESFQKLGYHASAINTSNADLDSNNCKTKHHIPTAFGCHGDMNVALEYAKDYWIPMCEFHDKYFPRQDIVFFAGSVGGATGARLIPIMLDIMSKRNPNKIYGAIIANPNKNESIQALKNARLSYKDITNVVNGKAIFSLDNNKYDRNKFELNDIFAHKFNEVINMTNPDMKGNVDESEIEFILNCQGNAIIEEWDESPSGTKTFTPNPFVSYLAGAQRIAWISKKEINIKELAFKVGSPKYQYHGFKSEKNLFIASGMRYPEILMDEYNEIIEGYKGITDVKGLEYEPKQREIIKDVFVNKEVIETKPKFNDDYFNTYRS